jgi:hypothetical protein
VLAALIPLLSACSTLEVMSDYDPNFAFEPLATYDWLPVEQARTGDPRIDDNTLLRDRIYSAVDAELASKGFRKAGEGDTPDFLVAYYVTLDRRTSVRTINHAYGYAAWGTPGYYYPGPYALGSDTYVYEYDEGTLVLDVVIPPDKRLVWRGSGTDEVRLKSTPSENEAAVREAVKRILAGFPPKPTAQSQK